MVVVSFWAKSKLRVVVRIAKFVFQNVKSAKHLLVLVLLLWHNKSQVFHANYILFFIYFFYIVNCKIWKLQQ